MIRLKKLIWNQILCFIATICDLGDMNDCIRRRLLYQFDNRAFSSFTLKDKIDLFRSESLILLFKMCNVFAGMLLPTLFVFMTESLFVLELTTVGN